MIFYCNPVVLYCYFSALEVVKFTLGQNNVQTSTTVWCCS